MSQIDSKYTYYKVLKPKDGITRQSYWVGSIIRVIDNFDAFELYNEVNNKWILQIFSIDIIYNTYRVRKLYTKELVLLSL